MHRRVVCNGASSPTSPQRQLQGQPRGEIEDVVVRVVIQHTDGTKLQADAVGLDLTALIDRWQVVKE